MSKSPLTQNRPEAAFTRLGIRPALVAFGWLNVGLGMLGTILPIMPTTVFLLVALWSFSKSSPYFHDWLYTHPRFGPTLKVWRDERAIPGARQGVRPPYDDSESCLDRCIRSAGRGRSSRVRGLGCARLVDCHPRTSSPQNRCETIYPGLATGTLGSQTPGFRPANHGHPQDREIKSR